MILHTRSIRWHITVLAGAVMFFLLDGLLLRGHARAVQDTREILLPLAADIAPLERRSRILGEQVELMQVQRSLRSGALQEKLRAYVLPMDGGAGRLAAALDLLRTRLQQERLLREMSAIEVEEQDLSFSVIARPEGGNHVLRFLDATGLLTVADALSREQREGLFQLVDAGNPTDIVALEWFLGLDILRYAEDPERAEEQFLTSLSSVPTASLMRRILDAPAFQDLTRALGGGLGQSLHSARLWPLPFSMIEDAEMETLPEGWEKIMLKVKVYGKK